MTANNRQVGGDHYRKHDAMQHWDYAVAKKFDMFQYQITKYVERWRDKNGTQDLEKALHFLEKYIEVEKARRLVPIHEDNTGQKHPFGYDPNLEMISLGGDMYPAPSINDSAAELDRLRGRDKHPIADAIQNQGSFDL